jgi:hypothetical protein
LLLVEEECTEGFQCLHHLFLHAHFGGVGEVHDTDIAGLFVVDLRFTALTASGVGAHSAMMLPQGSGEFTRADVANKLLLEELLASEFNL